ncbi:MAG: hypothetical protein AAB513_01645 [Patescibacteria group bacterium]
MDGINTSNQMGGAPIPTMNPMPENHQKTSAGPIIGSIIVVLVVVLGGLYLYGQQLGQKNLENVSPEEIGTTIDQATLNLEKQGATDDLGEINADLNTTNLDNLDAELKGIDAELTI